MNAPLDASLIEAAISGGIVLLFAAPAFFRKRSGYLLLAVILAFLDMFAQAWPQVRGTPLALIDGSWNWSGKVLEFALLILVAVLFVSTGLFRREEIGLTFKQRSGSLLIPIAAHNVSNTITTIVPVFF